MTVFPSVLTVELITAIPGLNAVCPGVNDLSFTATSLPVKAKKLATL